VAIYSIPKAVENNEKCFLLKGFSIHHTIKLGTEGKTYKA
jgi:hypothetical protein